MGNGEGKDAKEPTLRELIVDNHRLSSDVRQAADDIRSLENSEVQAAEQDEPTLGGIRGELIETQDNLNSALLDLRKVYGQLRKKVDTPPPSR